MKRHSPWLIALALAGAAGRAAAVLAVDEASAQMLARQSACLKCHAIEKVKVGPPFREIAAKYRGDSSAAPKLFAHVTTGKSVTFPDGHEESHKMVQTDDHDAIRNLVGWILAMP